MNFERAKTGVDPFHKKNRKHSRNFGFSIGFVHSGFPHTRILNSELEVIKLNGLSLCTSVAPEHPRCEKSEVGCYEVINNST